VRATACHSRLAGPTPLALTRGPASRLPPVPPQRGVPRWDPAPAQAAALQEIVLAHETAASESLTMYAAHAHGASASWTRQSRDFFGRRATSPRRGRREEPHRYASRGLTRDRGAHDRCDWSAVESSP